MNSTNANSFGLGCFGQGTGKYPPYAKGELTESQITRNISKAITEKYPEAFIHKIYSGGYMRSGIPDLYVAVDGYGIWIEVKRPTADTSALQKKCLEKLWAQGIPCGTAESPETALNMIKQVVGV